MHLYFVQTSTGKAAKSVFAREWNIKAPCTVSAAHAVALATA